MTITPRSPEHDPSAQDPMQEGASSAGRESPATEVAGLAPERAQQDDEEGLGLEPLTAKCDPLFEGVEKDTGKVYLLGPYGWKAGASANAVSTGPIAIGTALVMCFVGLAILLGAVGYVLDQVNAEPKIIAVVLCLVTAGGMTSMVLFIKMFRRK